MLIDDEWNGLADLLANLIAKYASELGIDDMPDPNQNREYKRRSMNTLIREKMNGHICCLEL